MGINYIGASLLNNSESPFYDFKTVGLSITKSADKLITDSAAGATAIATGYRINNKQISLDSEHNSILTIFEFAENFNLSTGLVVTSEVVDATPAAFIAHDNSRYDKEEIALQFVQSNINLVIGGGLKFFTSPENRGIRTDEKNLVEKIKSNRYEFFQNFNELEKTNPGKNFYALLADEGLPKAGERNYTLGQLTNIALQNLSQNPKGFILMVEGSQIDWAGHDNEPGYLLNELDDFSSAISASLEFAKADSNTLVLVTADHETGGLAITGGDPDGGNLELNFISKQHTAGVVAVLAYGPGKEQFDGIYNNYDIGRKLFHFLDANHSFTDKK